MSLYPPEQYRLVELRRGSPAKHFNALVRLITEQYKDEGMRVQTALPARVRESTKPGSGALFHLLIGPGQRALAYQFSNICRSLGGDYLYVNETYAAKSVRGLGLGWELEMRFVAWAKVRGYTSVCSRTGNPEMRRIVEKLGARVKPTTWVEIPLRPDGPTKRR